MQISDSSSRILAGLLEARTGQQLTMSRRWRLETALSQLLRERGIASIDELITILVMGREPSLSTRVVEALLNNETYFFRDRLPFDLIKAATLTDVSEGMVSRAREGSYTQFEVQRGLGIQQMIRWFEEGSAGWRAVEALRKSVRFQVHNLLEPAPHPGRFDLVLCRNVLLYLNENTRRKAFDRLSAALAPDGWLMLGAGETVIGQAPLLEADREMRGLYRHREPSVKAA
jgi:chemotaxis protein methyltransferase CheR